MSGPILDRAALARYQHDPNLEIRMPSSGQDRAVDARTGSVGGRLVRNLAIIFGSGPTTAEKASVMAAKQQTLRELKATFGDDIGERAFSAHIGKSDGRGGWMTSAAHPITGRHITAMIKTAQ
ncbi:MAG: hypothetical protein JO339_06640, partial [Alphaproteobacteria bacterium]|nr:hypothetical protein [Alphaproteobacteria bacterium]